MLGQANDVVRRDRGQCSPAGSGQQVDPEEWRSRATAGRHRPARARSRAQASASLREDGEPGARPARVQSRPSSHAPCGDADEGVSKFHVAGRTRSGAVTMDGDRMRRAPKGVAHGHAYCSEATERARCRSLVPVAHDQGSPQLAQWVVSPRCRARCRCEHASARRRARCGARASVAGGWAAGRPS